jgi:hypothetical protein
MVKVIYKHSNKIPLALLVLGGMVHASTYRGVPNVFDLASSAVWRACRHRRRATISEAFAPVVPSDGGHNTGSSNSQPGITPHAFQICASDTGQNGDSAHYSSLPGSSGGRPTAQTNATLTLTGKPVEMIAVKLYTLGGNYVDTVKIPEGTTNEDAESIVLNELNAGVLSILSILSQSYKPSTVWKPLYEQNADLFMKLREYLSQSVLVPIIGTSPPKLVMSVQDEHVKFAFYIPDRAIANQKFESNSLSVKRGTLNELLNELIRIKLPENTSPSENVEVILTVEKKGSYNHYNNTLRELFFKIAEKTARDLGFNDNNTHRDIDGIELKDQYGRFQLAIWSVCEGPSWQIYDRYSVICSTEMSTRNIDIPSGSDISQYMEQNFKDLAKRLCYDDETEYNIQIDSETKVITLKDKKGCILIQGNVVPETRSYKVSFTRDCLIGSGCRTAKRIRETLQEQETAGEPVAPEPNPPVAPEPNLL